MDVNGHFSVVVYLKKLFLVGPNMEYASWPEKCLSRPFGLADMLWGSTTNQNPSVINIASCEKSLNSISQYGGV